MLETEQKGKPSALPSDSGPAIPFETLNFGAMVRILRLKVGFTQEELAKGIESDKSKISEFETGVSLPRATTVAKLIEALELEPDSIEIKLLTSRYLVDAEKRKSDYLRPEEHVALDQRLRSHSDGTINYSALARELGISRRTVSITHHALQTANPNTPANIRDERAREGLPLRIKDYRNAGRGIKEIARSLHVSQAYIRTILTEAGETPRPRGRTEEELELTDSQVKSLYDQNLTYPQIAEAIGQPVHIVDHSIRRLKRKGLVEPRRTQKKKGNST